MYIACDQSSYTDGGIDGNTFTEPTISQRMVFEIRPASEMADSIENVYTKGEWLEEYDIMAPTGQNLFIGPKYAFKSETRSYPAYFYKSKGSVQQMNTSGFSNNNKKASSVIGDWKQKQIYPTTTTTRYVCNKDYSVTDINGNILLQAQRAIVPTRHPILQLHNSGHKR